SRARVIRFGRLSSSRVQPACRGIARTVGPSGISGTIAGGVQPALLRCRRAGAREPPLWRALWRHARRGCTLRIAADEVELRFGQAGLQLIDAPEIFDLDRCLLQRQSHQADFADRRQSGEALAHPHPILEAGDRQGGSQASLLIVTRESGLLPAALDIAGDNAHSAPQKLLAALAGVSG